MGEIVLKRGGSTLTINVQDIKTCAMPKPRFGIAVEKKPSAQVSKSAPITVSFSNLMCGRSGHQRIWDPDNDSSWARQGNCWKRHRDTQYRPV